MCDDETAAAKFAVRQVNGIAPKLSVRSEPKTGRKCEKVRALIPSISAPLSVPFVLNASSLDCCHPVDAAGVMQSEQLWLHVSVSVQTIDLLRETTGIFEKEIPALRQQVAAAEKRIAQLERNKFRRGRRCVRRGLLHGADGDGGCSKSAAAGRSKLPWGKVGQDRTQRQMYLPSARPGG